MLLLASRSTSGGEITIGLSVLSIVLEKIDPIAFQA
jgi:hypothetical protein